MGVRVADLLIIALIVTPENVYSCYEVKQLLLCAYDKNYGCLKRHGLKKPQRNPTRTQFFFRTTNRVANTHSSHLMVNTHHSLYTPGTQEASQA